MNKNRVLDVLCKSLDILFNMNNELQIIPNTNSNLIFPIKPNSDNTVRVSEQELRQTIISLLKANEYYSIETPTVKKYSFTGKKLLSANLDLCFYEKVKGKFDRKNNIELKAQNISQSYYNDFWKLTYEEGNNYYVHLLEGINNGTLLNVLSKFSKDLKALKKGICSKSLTIVVMSLRPKILLYKTFGQKILKAKKADLDLKYEVEKNKVKLIKPNNWTNVLP